MWVSHFRGTNADIARQARIDRQRHALHRNARLGGEGRHLSKSMHSRIGAACTHDNDWALHGDGNSGLQHALHRAQ